MTSDCAKWRGDMQNLRRLLLYNVMKSLVDDSPQEDYFDRVTSPTQVSQNLGRRPAVADYGNPVNCRPRLGLGLSREWAGDIWLSIRCGGSSNIAQTTFSWQKEMNIRVDDIGR